MPTTKPKPVRSCGSYSVMYQVHPDQGVKYFAYTIASPPLPSCAYRFGVSGGILRPLILTPHSSQSAVLKLGAAGRSTNSWKLHDWYWMAIRCVWQLISTI